MLSYFFFIIIYMKGKWGLTDYVTALIFPEARLLAEFFASKGVSNLAKRNLSKLGAEYHKLLPKIPPEIDSKKLQKEIANLIQVPIKDLQRAFIEQPARLAESLAKLTPQGRREFSDLLQQELGVGQSDASSLSSSAVSHGTFIVTGEGVGDLELKFIDSNKTYTYHGVPLSIWTEMKAAKGKNGGGAYSVFYYGYLRGAQKTQGYKQLTIAYRLAGIK